MQKTVIEHTNLDRKTVYLAERQLIELGLIGHSAEDNGKRVGPGHAPCSIAKGIEFAPLIANYHALKREAEAHEAALRTLQAERSRCSSLRFALRRLLRKLTPSLHLSRLILMFEALPRRLKAMTDVDRLRWLSQVFQELVGLARGLLSNEQTSPEPSTPQSDATNSDEVPHAASENSPQHIYTTTNPSSVPCNIAENSKSQPQPLGTNVAQDTDVAANRPVNWTIAQLARIATPEFLSDLDLCRPMTRPPSSSDIISAADHATRRLGISRHAWSEACAILGPADAALSIIVIDRNTSHPVTPIRNPGGCLRAMVRRYIQGELNLDQSVFALLKKDKPDDHS